MAKTLIQIGIEDEMNSLIEDYLSALKRLGVKKTKQKIVEEIVNGKLSKTTLSQKLRRSNAAYEKAFKELNGKSAKD